MSARRTDLFGSHSFASKSVSSGKKNGRGANLTFGIAGLFLFASNAYAQESSDELSDASGSESGGYKPDGFIEATRLENVSDVRLVADGTVELVMADGTVVRVPAESVQVARGKIFVEEAALDGLLSGLSVMDMVYWGVGLGAVGVGAHSVIDDDDSSTPANLAPEFVSSSGFAVDENSLSVGAVEASDRENDELTFSISGGADASLFSIDGQTGALSFSAAPDYESPGDSDGDNQYEVEVSVTDGTSTVAQLLNVDLGNLNDNQPVITSAGQVSMDENGQAVSTVVATDADGDSISFAISGGMDSALFQINAATGELTFVAAPDFENPGDADSDNTYVVEVTASDGVNDVVQEIAITIGNVNDTDPQITSALAVSVDENQTTAHTISASDADGDTLTYSISSGADANLVTIDPNTGVVSFVTPPDFEAPADADQDNVYDFSVTASDGSRSSTAQVSVSVVNLNDSTPIIATSGNVALDENLSAVLDIDASDADGDALTYSIAGGVDAALFTINSSTGELAFSTPPDFEAPTDADADNVYEVDVVVSDGVNPAQLSVAATIQDSTNEVAPVFTSSTSASVNENQTSAYSAAATDGDGNTLTYAIAGGADAALFSIDPNSGVMSFITAPDFEAPADADQNNVYDVDVSVSDGVNTVQQSVAISVGDINDNAPVITSAASVNIAENIATAYATTATDINGDTLTYSLSGGADEALFNIDPNTGVLTFINPPNFESPSDANADNIYDVEVTVSDGLNQTSQPVSITVADANDAPVFTSSSAFSRPEAGGAIFEFITVTDEDGTTYNLAGGNLTITGGPDAGLVQLLQSGNSPVWLIATTLNYEFPSDGNGDNVYEFDLTATDGGTSVTQTVSLTITDVNEPPARTSALNAQVAENTAGTVYTASGTDPEGTTVTFSILGGPDAALFNIDPNTGELAFNSAPDFETPLDTNGDSIYGVEIGYSDGVNTPGVLTYITVTNVNDNTPVVTNDPLVLHEENQLAALTVVGTDADGDTLTYSISGGADAALFSIDPNTGAVSFNSAPSFSTPADANGDNDYEIEVTSFDGVNTSTPQAVTISVFEPAPQISLGGIQPSEGFVAVGENSGDLSGGDIAIINDVNGDGFADWMIGAEGSDQPLQNNGLTYVLFGDGTAPGTVVNGRMQFDLSSMTASDGFVIQGDAQGDNSGNSVASAGDINGDGIGDLVITAKSGGDGGAVAGEAYVVFGTTGGFGTVVNGRQTIDLSSISPSQGFIIQGDEGGDRVSDATSAGDVNGDGIDDLIVGAGEGDDGGTLAGEAYVIFGSDAGFGANVSGRQVLDLTTLAASEGFIVQGDTAGDRLGTRVSAGGDVNGDGFADLLVGAYAGDDGGPGAGETYVIFGGAGAFGSAVSGRQVIDTTSLAASEGFILQGSVNNATTGFGISSAGDVNADGFDDMIVGAPFANLGNPTFGEAYIVYGGAGTFGSAVTVNGETRQVIDLANMQGSEGVHILPDTDSAGVGYAVSAAGDVNGDGIADVVVGVRPQSTPTGESFVLYGNAGGLGIAQNGQQVIDLSELTSQQGFELASSETFRSVAGGGDINGDGFDDLMLSYPYISGVGETYVIYGGQFGAASSAVVNLVGTAGADQLNGGLGADTLNGGGGADVLNGGNGDDNLIIQDTSFAYLDGDSGTDTLTLDGSGLTLDLTQPGTAAIYSIENIDITGAGNNSLILDAQAVFDLTEERTAGTTTIQVFGNAGDSVDLAGFSSNGTTTLNGVSFNVYQDGNAVVNVQTGVAVNTPPAVNLVFNSLLSVEDGTGFGGSGLSVDVPLDLNGGLGGSPGASMDAFGIADWGDAAASSVPEASELFHTDLSSHGQLADLQDWIQIPALPETQWFDL